MIMVLLVDASHCFDVNCNHFVILMEITDLLAYVLTVCTYVAASKCIVVFTQTLNEDNAFARKLLSMTHFIKEAFPHGTYLESCF